ncbi:MAG: hypothetical protein NW241_14610 [Bacteroidia bacterium]|nr:hypothetical protein [Bacteroidia bacterium]
MPPPSSQPSGAAASRTAIRRREPVRQVLQFRIHHARSSSLSFPYWLMLVCLGLLLGIGIYRQQTAGEWTMLELTGWMSLMFVPIFAPAGWLLSCWVRKERGTRIELDLASDLIQYTNPRLGVNVLFHVSQIESCEWLHSLLLPMNVDVLRLHLAGGPSICVSSLVLETAELMEWYRIPFQIRNCWINSLP